MMQADKTARADQRVKFLGLAFAGADLAFEVDQTGVIRFAIGAVEQITGIPQAKFVGQTWTAMVIDADADVLQSLLQSLGPGERHGPLRVGLKPRKAGGLTRFASLSVFRLPQNEDGLSCALSLGAPPVQGEFPRNALGLLDRSTFDEATATTVAEATRAGHPVALALVELQGLDGSMAALDAPAAEAARKKISAALQLESYGGVGASEIGPERYAFVRSTTTPASRIAERLRAVCGDNVTAVTADLLLDESTPGQSLKAVRYALNQFMEAGPEESAMGFSSMLERTARDAARFKSTLAAGTFNLVYQPVVDLAANQPHHFEALVRFAGADSPAAAIQLAEETGMIIDFDLAVAKGVVRVLEIQKPWKIAINLSALSLMAPRCIDALAELTARNPALRRRLLIEVTETQKLHDLDAANQAISRLRKLGHPICLDDFGAGSASLDYLSRLEVDFVKIDGRYIRNLKTQPRDLLIVKHVAALCQDLGVKVIAEMIETEESAAAVKALGIPLGQGWLYGKPADMPTWPPATAGGSVARRSGVVEQWG